MTIKEIQDELTEWHKRTWPQGVSSGIAGRKVSEEYREWIAIKAWHDDREECADVIISMLGYMIARGYDAEQVITDKLAIVVARTDQVERDKERGIG